MREQILKTTHKRDKVIKIPRHPLVYCPDLDLFFDIYARKFMRLVPLDDSALADYMVKQYEPYKELIEDDEVSPEPITTPQGYDFTRYSAESIRELDKCRARNDSLLHGEDD